jgi:superoxide dismutase, Cu-Zn family
MVEVVRAICIMKADPQASRRNLQVEGKVFFEQNPNTQEVVITGRLSGLTPGKHGFHVHQYGDLSNGCTSNGPHLNPHQKTHGAPTDAERHVGDLGNVVADADGNAEVNISDKIVSLKPGTNCIIG